MHLCTLLKPWLFPSPSIFEEPAEPSVFRVGYYTAQIWAEVTRCQVRNVCIISTSPLLLHYSVSLIDILGGWCHSFLTFRWMSGFASEPTRTDERIQYASRHHGAPAYRPGERHTVPDNDFSDKGDTVAMADRNGETDISASQKMLSAVSGSLLTSLLGEISRRLKCRSQKKQNSNIE